MEGKTLAGFNEGQYLGWKKTISDANKLYIQCVRIKRHKMGQKVFLLARFDWSACNCQWK